MIFSNFKIGSRLGFGFILIFLLLTSVTLFGINRMDLLSDQTVKMYNHPLAASNAVLRINANIIKIYHSMKDITLAQDIESIQESSQIVDALEKDVFRDFEIINERFLGEKEKYESALGVFTAWKPIRDKAIALMRAGKKVEADDITKGKGTHHVVKIEKAMEALGECAQNKASKFLYTAERTREDAFNTIYLLLVIATILSVTFAVYLTKSITCPIKAVRAATDKFGKGLLNTVIEINSRDEIGQLANSFNKMTEDLKSITASRDELNKEIAERKQAEEKLKKAQSKIIQQEKMASIGQLAAGVAHEINNPTGFVSSNLGTLRNYINKLTEFIDAQSGAIESLKSSEISKRLKEKRIKLKLDYILKDVKDLIKESHDGTERIKKIVQNLKSFARVDESERKFADINECVESTLNIVWNELKYKTLLEKEYGDIPLTKCYPQQLNHVFMNLLVNAGHAIEKQGKIKIRTWNGDGTINVSISDTGFGIPEDKISRIFEPFFTTKAIGKGTGLGLSISYDIMKKHNGKITVDSKAGKGTTFTVKIPIVEG